MLLSSSPPEVCCENPSLQWESRRIVDRFADVLACATCGSPAIPGLAAKDQWGAYPMPAERSGPLLRLEGADERVLRIAPVEPLDLRGPSLELFVPGDPLAPRTVAAGFTLRHAAVGLHVCGPEVSLKVALP